MLGPERLRPADLARSRLQAPSARRAELRAPSPGLPVQHIRNRSPPCLGSGGPCLAFPSRAPFTLCKTPP